MEFLLKDLEVQVGCVETFKEILEFAFLDGQIDGESQNLAYLWLTTNPQLLQ